MYYVLCMSHFTPFNLVVSENNVLYINLCSIIGKLHFIFFYNFIFNIFFSLPPYLLCDHVAIVGSSSPNTNIVLTSQPAPTKLYPSWY